MMPHIAFIKKKSAKENHEQFMEKIESLNSNIIG